MKLLGIEERPKDTLVDGHTLVAQSLKSLGVTHAYCLAGTPIRETFAYCAKVGIRNIGVRHQQAAVLMATAQNYIAGRLTSIVILSAGPAVTNAVTGVLVARDNCWPVVVLGGRRPLSMQGMGSFQELDAVPIFQSITKWSAVVDATERIPEYLSRAFQLAMSGRSGPVYLDMPEDVLTGFVRSYELPSLEIVKAAAPDREAIAKAAECLLRAERPALILGKGVRWSAAYKELNQLVDDFGIPFVASPMGRGYLPDDHPLGFNEARSLFQAKADVILLAGARLDWTFRFGSEFARDAKIIQIDIHEPEIGANVTPYVGIVGDLKAVLGQIVSHMKLKQDNGNKERRTAWHCVLNEAKRPRTKMLDELTRSNGIPMSPYRMLGEIRDFLPRDAICVLDGNVSMAAAQQVLPSLVPVSRLTAGTNGCMGVGIPFAIGAKLAEPDRMVVAICGDAAFAFNAMDMETAVRHRIPVVIIVVNNEGNSGGLMQRAFYLQEFERVTMFQPDIRYEAIMRAFGGYAEFVDSPEDIKPALHRAVASGKPACINVKVDPFAPYPRD
jgi:thiamine pyrophosphate-dependent acetolactate synthase large subunit-like protein